MKLYIKVAVAFFFLLAGIVIFMNRFSPPPIKDKFELIDSIQESDIVYPVNIIQLLNKVIQYNSEFVKSLTRKIALNELKNQLIESGIDVQHAYFTFSFSKKKGSIYARIKDDQLFETAFDKLSNYFILKPIKNNSTYFISERNNLVVEKHSQFLKLNFGIGTEKASFDELPKLSSFFKELIRDKDKGIINTTGTAHLDSTDYATFSISYDKHFSLEVDWKVSEDHPLQKKQSSIQIYPSQEEKVRAFTKIDIDYFLKHINPYLKKVGTEEMNKLPQAAKDLLASWNGQFSFQIGGKTAQKTIQYSTEFDEDFNPVEKEVIKIDSIPDIGFYWGSHQPKSSVQLFGELPNVELQNRKIQIALLPPLLTKTDEKSLKASSREMDFEDKDFQQLLFVKSDIKGLKAQLSASKSSKNNVHLELEIKDWRLLTDPKSFKASSFW